MQGCDVCDSHMGSDYCTSCSAGYIMNVVVASDGISYGTCTICADPSTWSPGGDLTACRFCMRNLDSMLFR